MIKHDSLRFIPKLCVVHVSVEVTQGMGLDMDSPLAGVQFTEHLLSLFRSEAMKVWETMPPLVKNILN